MFGNAGSHPGDHVEPAVDEMLDQKWRFGRIVGSITVDHHVHVGEHPAYHISIPKSRFKTDHRARFEGPGHRLVNGSVVVYVNGGFRKHRTKTGGNATDGGFFVPAGNQNSNFDVQVAHLTIWRSFGLRAFPIPKRTSVQR